MKTLKQLMDERNLPTFFAIQAVKEWLTQKRQDYLNTHTPYQDKNPCFPVALKCYNELLEELAQ